MDAVILVVFWLIMLRGFISTENTLKCMTNRQPKNCIELPPPVLSNILGPAFNSRYMSIDKPPVMQDESANGEIGGKRVAKSGLYPSFYVDEDHLAELGNNPAWAVNHVEETANPVLKAPLNKREVFDSLLDEITMESRSKRSSRRSQTGDGSSRPWECDSKVRWTDLGPEYFPRFLRTVECTKTRCWYGHYQCRPRSFTVKMLRKRTGQCVPANKLYKIGVEGLPGDLSELWVWEERAVIFCCDCAPRF